MIAMNLAARFERKFVAEGFTLADVLALVRRHRAAFREAFPARIVSNVYFDSPGLAGYHDHMNGVSDRVKTRIRWYSPQQEIVQNAQLERKLKHGTVSTKKSYAIPSFALDWRQIARQLEVAIERANLPEIVRIDVRRLEPSLFNRYRRHYFVSADARYRLTVDSELQFGAVRKNNGAELFLSPIDGDPILELHLDANGHENGSLVANALPFRMTRCSKYVLGIERSANL